MTVSLDTPVDMPAAAEQYRKVAAVLHQAQQERGIRTVLIASAAAGDGKSRTTAALGLSLSRSYGSRVLLVDADLRRPVLHAVLGVPNVRGLNELLAADTTPIELATVPVGAAGAELLPAGRPNPEPLRALTSPRMRDLLAHASIAFDWVLVDTPPLALLPDAEIVASMVDAALLVVAAGHTDYRIVTKAVAAIGRDRIVGVVLNKIDDRSSLPVYAAYDYAAAGTR